MPTHKRLAPAALYRHRPHVWLCVPSHVQNEPFPTCQLAMQNNPDLMQINAQSSGRARYSICGHGGGRCSRGRVIPEPIRCRDDSFPPKLRAVSRISGAAFLCAASGAPRPVLAVRRQFLSASAFKLPVGRLFCY